ncbi:hypothetical protein GCM10009111_15230 [Colwellia asteriadis]|uniref:HTH araC/xylS-type domain-containing protein n=1 Tax=Colwellia asteriadis TaxID=517723 RepID=A0ABN1L644_9GAMM
MLVNELSQVWYIMSATLGLWTFLSLLRSPQGDIIANRLMSLFVLCLSIPSIDAYLFQAGYETPLWLYHARVTLTLLYGPLLWIIINRIVLNKQPWYWQLSHTLPFVFFNSLLIINTQFPFNVYLPLLALQLLSYAVLSIRVLFEHKHKLKRLLGAHKFTSFYWLLFLAMTLLGLVIFDVAIWIYTLTSGSPNISLVNVIASLIIALTNIIALFSLYQPNLFFNHLININIEQASANDSQSSYDGFSAEVSTQLVQQLASLMSAEQLYLDGDISLAQLAGRLNISSHQLSELLNNVINQSFYEYLNEWRLNYALELLNNDKFKLTMADLAYQAGFNNRTSFYRVFKQKTGLTPTAYKKKMG